MKAAKVLISSFYDVDKRRNMVYRVSTLSKPFCLSACTLFVSAQLVNRLLRTPQNNLYVCFFFVCVFFIIGAFLFFVVVIVQTMHHENIPI